MAIFGGDSGDKLNIEVSLEAEKAIKQAEELGQAINKVTKESEGFTGLKLSPEDEARLKAQVEKIQELQKKTKELKDTEETRVDSLKKTAATSDIAKSSTEGLSSAFGSIISTGIKLAGAYDLVVGAALGYVYAVQKLADKGEVYTSLSNSFDSLGGSSQVLTEVKDRTIGLISEVDALKLSNQALNLGLPEFNNNFALVSEYGARLAQTLGEKTVPTIEKVVKAIAQGQPELLQQVGLLTDSAQAFQAYADKMGITGRELGQLEKKAAISEAAISILGDKMQKLGPIQDSVSNASAALGNTFGNVMTHFSEGLNNNDNLTDSFRRLDEKLADLDLVSVGDAVGDLASKVLDLATDALTPAIEGIQGLNTALAVLSKLSVSTNPVINHITVGIKRMGDIAGVVYNNITSTVGEVAEATLGYKTALEEVKKEQEEADTQEADRAAYRKQEIADRQELRLKLKQEEDARIALKEEKRKQALIDAANLREANKLLGEQATAFQNLQKELRTTTEKATIDTLSDKLKTAMELKDTGLATQLKDMIYQNVRAGLEAGFKDAKGVVTPESSKALDDLAKIKTNTISTDIEKGVDKGLKDGFFNSQLPNYLSEMITNSLIDGFSDGLNSDTILQAGKALSSVFAQNFQDSFKKLFGDSKDGGGFTSGNIVGSLANLGATYGINSLFQNLSDNKKDPVGGAVAGTIAGASIGTMILPGVGTAVGAGVGGLGGYIAGTFGKGTNDQTNARHDTINYIEGLIAGDNLSFLQNGNNIQEGGNTRFNTTASGGWLQSLGEGFVDAAANAAAAYFGGPAGVVGLNVGTGGSPHTAAAEALASPPPTPGTIQGPGWADQYWQAFGQDGGEAFMALGSAFSEMAGTMGPQMSQIGVILAENLNGNLDNARMLLQTIGLGAQDLEQSFLNIGLSGEESWHTVEIYMQSINDLTGEGLIGIGDLEGAMAQFINSGGRGQEALIALRNLGIEAMEAGAKSMDELRAHLEASGKYSVEQINAIMTALSQRGINSLEDLANASDRNLGGVTADAESLGFAFEDAIGGGVDGAINSVKELQQAIKDMPDKIEKKLTLKVSTDFADSASEAVYKDATSNSRSRGVPRE